MRNYVTRTVLDDPKNRDPHDFYPTPRVAIEALLNVEAFVGQIWEPACGDGAISRVLEERGYDVISSDLYDRGFGHVGIDFLRPRGFSQVDNVITNPPFKASLAFALRALEVSRGKVALLARLAWLEGKERREKLFTATPLARVYVFSQRVHFARSGLPSNIGSSDGVGGMQAYAWYVWDKAYRSKTTLEWLEPKGK